MPKSNRCVLVLWAGGFEEAAATIFITELRNAGIQVKVVSLTRHQARGAHGLALVPDLTLSQARSLLADTTHLIIPATWQATQTLKNDPYLSEFFEYVSRYHIPILIPGNGDLSLDSIFAVMKNVKYFPVENAFLIEFLQDFVHSAGIEGNNFYPNESL